MFGIYMKTRTFIMDEKDVTTVLGIINQALPVWAREVRVSTCGWADEPEKWFIMFHTTDKQYGDIMRELMKIGSVSIELRDGGSIVDYVFRMGV
jgi:hypothetical protein